MKLKKKIYIYTYLYLYLYNIRTIKLIRLSTVEKIAVIRDKLTSFKNCRRLRFLRNSCNYNLCLSSKKIIFSPLYFSPRNYGNSNNTHRGFFFISFQHKVIYNSSTIA